MLRVAASAGVQLVLDAAGMTAADLQEMEREGVQLVTTIKKKTSILVSTANELSGPLI